MIYRYRNAAFLSHPRDHLLVESGADGCPGAAATGRILNAQLAILTVIIIAAC